MKNPCPDCILQPTCPNCGCKIDEENWNPEKGMCEWCAQEKVVDEILEE